MAGILADADDGDDLLQNIEASFQVSFGAEVAAWQTLGDVHEALLRRLGTESPNGSCATSMAFYRVRKALAELAPEQRVTPDARLGDLTRLRPKALNAHLSKRLGLRVGELTLSWWGCSAALIVAIVSIAAGVLWPAFRFVGVAGICAGVLVLRLDGGMYGRMTVGDLARTIARDNFEHLAALGADRRPEAVWRTLCALVREYVAEDAPLTPQSRLLG